MLITNASRISERDTAKFAWNGLRRFQNTQHVTKILCKKHNVPDKFKKNVEKQAEQIRYFIIQAKEYFDAHEAVSLVTKPVLLYYSIMCLATAEILFKQSGESSIDKARDNHRHHGLTFINRSSKILPDELSLSAEALWAKPAFNNDGRFGTFELWHRSAREYPVAADMITIDQSSRLESFGAVMVGSDVRFDLFPENGISFLDAVRSIPGLFNLMHNMEVSPYFIRSHVTLTFNNIDASGSLKLILHPSEMAAGQSFLDNIQIYPGDADHVIYNPRPDTNYFGGEIILPFKNRKPLVRVQLSQAASIKYPTILFSSKSHTLNEFGFLYVALFMAGNYARYYPDFWMHDVEHHTEIGIVMQELVTTSSERMALLLLGELTNTYYVP